MKYIRCIVKKKIPDALFLKIRFKKIMRRKLDLKHPKTYNEKLQWLKLYDRKPEYTTLADKYEVKKYVANIIGEKYIIPTLGVWNRTNEIDFGSLPERFVLKCTHDSGGLVICKQKEKLNIEKVKEKLEESLKKNFFWESREWPYKNIKPRIIAETLIGSIDSLPYDYKFFTFDGVIDSIMVCTNREMGKPNFYFYDKEWNRLYYQHPSLEREDDVCVPPNLNTMIMIVEKLSSGFAHMRVDLYNINGEIYFGEMTFYNQSGFDTDISEKTDLIWGEKLKIKTK